MPDIQFTSEPSKNLFFLISFSVIFILRVFVFFLGFNNLREKKKKEKIGVYCLFTYE